MQISPPTLARRVSAPPPLPRSAPSIPDSSWTQHSPATSARLRWLLVLAGGLLLVLLNVPGRVLTSVSYAVERGVIQANLEGLAEIESVSQGFRMVAKSARPGVVHINVGGAPTAEIEAVRRRIDARAAELASLEERLLENIDGVDPKTLREQLELRRNAEEIGREIESLYARLRDLTGRRDEGSGSGFILDERGHILTNNHVVAGQSRIVVTLHDERQFEAKLVGTDPKTDVAVIRIDAADIHALPVGDSDEMEVGDWVIAVGAPFGLEQTVTHGIISAKGRHNLVQRAGIIYQDFLQTDASINPGNSGGPLLNLRGEVIGVNAAIATDTGANMGVAFTIPANLALRVAEQLIQNGVVQRGWLGVTLMPLSREEAKISGVAHGVLVDEIIVDSPAAKADLRCEDLILSVNGEPVREIAQVQQLVAELGPQQTAKFLIQRDGASLQLDVQLGLQPENMNSVRNRARTIDSRWFEPLGVEVRSYRTADGIPQGVRVGRNRTSQEPPPGALIVRANRSQIRTVAELGAALRAASDEVELEYVDADGKTVRRTIELARE